MSPLIDHFVNDHLGGWEQVWRAVVWVVLGLCVLSSSMSACLGFMGAKCGPRFTLMTAMGFACSVSFWYRIWLMSACLANRYYTTFAGPLVHIIMVLSGMATTVFYTCLASTCLHTFIAITLHPSQYDPIAASRTYVAASFVLAGVSTVVKWSMAVFLSAVHDERARKAQELGVAPSEVHLIKQHELLKGLFGKDELQPSPLTADGTPWAPKVKLLFWEFRPWKAKPHSVVNLFLLLVIGAAGPIFLSYVLRKMLAIRREAAKRLGPDAHCSITQAHIIRLIATMVCVFGLSLTSIVTMMIDLAGRNHRHLNLYVLPTSKDLCLRYTFSCMTGSFLFVIYVTGDELKWTWYEFLKHSALKQMRRPCHCRRCVCGESGYSAEFVLNEGVDPITTLPVGMARSIEEGDEEDGEVDFFAALKSTSKPHQIQRKKETRPRTMSIDSIMTELERNELAGKRPPTPPESVESIV